MGRLGLVLGALTVLLVLAASLPALDFRPDWAGQIVGAGPPGGPGFALSGWQVRVLVGLTLTVLSVFFVLSVALSSRRQTALPRKNFSVLALVLTLLVLTLIPPETLRKLLRVGAVDAPGASPGTVTTPPVALVTVPPASEAFIFGLSLAAAALLVLAAGWAWRRWRRPPAPARVQPQLAQVAQAALQDLQRGANFTNVILRCYHAMSQIVAEKRDLRRATGMTPREFLRRMEKAGVPEAAAGQLTALFEVARYSTHPLDAGQEAAALACLQTLARALDR